jgi:hypothetical protein
MFEGALGHSEAISRSERALRLAAAFACTLALGGCGGVEFQGKVFDYMGISGDRQQADVHMAERPPLLLPPNPKALPQPGTGVAVATAREDWPDDPERAKKRIASQKAAADAKKEAANDPSNPYAGKPTLLDKVFGPSKDEEEPVADVPEPDPSDKTPQDRAQGAVASTGPKPLTPHASADAPPAAPADDAFHPAAPDSYKGMSNPSGNNANY